MFFSVTAHLFDALLEFIQIPRISDHDTDLEIRALQEILRQAFSPELANLDLGCRKE